MKMRLGLLAWVTSGWAEAEAYEVRVKMEVGLTGPALTLSSSPLAGDSLVGTIVLYQPVGGVPASYTGKFVAHQRR